MKTVLFSSQSETESFAKALARVLAPGDVLLLSGDVGGGKSTFARALIRHLTSPDEEVPSPTFTLVQTYESEKFPIWHFDLYRLELPEEVWELGVEDIQKGIALIEWPEKMGPYIPSEALHLTFEYGETEEERRVTLKAPVQWINRIQNLIP